MRLLGFIAVTAVLIRALPIPQITNSTAVEEPRPLRILYDLIGEDNDSRTDSSLRTSTAEEFFTCSSGGSSSSAQEMSFTTVSDDSDAKTPQQPEPEGFQILLQGMQ